MAEDIVVYSGDGEPGKRQLIEMTLREHGIQFYVRSAGAIAEHPMSVGPMSEFKIYVSPAEEARAKAVVSEAVESVAALPSDDESDDAQGLLIRNRTTEKDKKVLLVAGIVLIALGSVSLFLWPSPVVVLGILCLGVVGPLMIAASRPGGADE